MRSDSQSTAVSTLHSSLSWLTHWPPLTAPPLPTCLPLLLPGSQRPLRPALCRPPIGQYHQNQLIYRPMGGGNEPTWLGASQSESARQFGPRQCDCLAGGRERVISLQGTYLVISNIEKWNYHNKIISKLTPLLAPPAPPVIAACLDILGS